MPHANESSLLRTSTSLDALPIEVILEIIPYVTFTPQTLSYLRQTSKRLHEIISRHERTLVNDLKRTQFCKSSLQLFPSLSITTFTGLSILYHRLTNLTSLHSHWLEITSHGSDLSWLKGRWETIHKIGLLLLYRLQDSGSYCHKVALINGLPSTSLACILFKLVSSIKILRVYGPCPINARHLAGDIMARSDIELAFEEMVLTHGPKFFIALLQCSSKPERGDWAMDALNTEIAGMFDRQRPTPEGIPQPPTLTSCLRRAFAAKMGCHVSHNVGKMWEVLSSTGFDEIDEEKMITVVTGEELKGVMKRIF